MPCTETYCFFSVNGGPSFVPRGQRQLVIQNRNTHSLTWWWLRIRSLEEWSFLLLRRYTKRYVAIRQSSRLRSIHLISCRRMAGQRVFMQIYPVPYYERIYLLSQTWRFDMPASISHVISGHDKIVTVCVMFIIKCCCCCCYMQFLSPLPNPAQSPPPHPLTLHPISTKSKAGLRNLFWATVNQTYITLRRIWGSFQ